MRNAQIFTLFIPSGIIPKQKSDLVTHISTNIYINLKWPYFTWFLTVFPRLTVATTLNECQAPGAWNGIRVHFVRREVGTTAIAQTSRGRQVRVQRAGQMDTSCYASRCVWKEEWWCSVRCCCCCCCCWWWWWWWWLLFLVVRIILNQSKKLIYHSTYMDIYIYKYICMNIIMTWYIARHLYILW